MWFECFFRAKTWSWWFYSLSVSSLWAEDVLMFTFSRTSTLSFACIPVDTGRKLNVHKTFRRPPELLLNVLCTFNLRPVSIGILLVLTHLFVVTILLVLQPYLNVQPCLTHLQIFLAMSQMTWSSFLCAQILQKILQGACFEILVPFFKNLNAILIWIYNWRVNDNKFYWSGSILFIFKLFWYFPF